MPATSYMEIIASRDCATLHGQHIIPGTVVHTDEQIADGTITLLISDVVSHSVVNQS